jgi:hypothetical protein
MFMNYEKESAFFARKQRQCRRFNNSYMSKRYQTKVEGEVNRLALLLLGL